MTKPETKSNLQVAIDAMNQLNVEEKRALNHILCDSIRDEHRLAAQSKISEFKRGDIVTFVKSGRGRNAGRHYVKVHNWNRAGTGLQGPECDKDGKEFQFGVKWTLDPTKCTKVEVAKKAA